MGHEVVKKKLSSRNDHLLASCKSICEKQAAGYESYEEAPFWAAFLAYLGYLILNVLGWIRDSMRFFGLEEKKGAKDPNPSVSSKNWFN